MFITQAILTLAWHWFSQPLFVDPPCHSRCLAWINTVVLQELEDVHELDHPPQRIP